MKRYVYQFWLNLGTSSHLYVKDNLSNNMNSWSLRFQVWLMVQVSDSPFFTFFNPVPYVVESCTIRDGKKWVTPPILWIAIQVGWCHALTRNTFMKLSLDRKSFSSCSNSKTAAAAIQPRLRFYGFWYSNAVLWLCSLEMYNYREFARGADFLRNLLNLRSASVIEIFLLVSKLQIGVQIMDR